MGGTEVTIIEFSKILSKFHDITIVTSSNKKTQNFKEFEIENKKINFKYFKCYPLGSLNLKEGLNSWDFEGLNFGEITKEFYNKEDFDAIITFYMADIVLLNKKKSKVILHLQGYPDQKKFLDLIALNKADFKIACSKHVAKKIEKIFDKKVDKIYHSSPDLKKFIPKDVKRKIDILYLGRLTKRKGADILLESLKKIKNEFNSCVIAGEGHLEKDLAVLIKKYGLSDKVKLLGIVQIRESIKLYNQSKIFVLPARRKEPFPKSIIEAMLMECNVISTKVGGIPELLKNNKNGILIKPNSSESLANAIRLLIKDKGKAKILASEGQNQMLRKFKKEEKEKELLNIYRKFLNNK